jgi:hypothetical protein
MASAKKTVPSTFFIDAGSSFPYIAVSAARAATKATSSSKYFVAAPVFEN